MTADLTARLLTGPGPLHPALTEELALALGRVLRAAPGTSALLNVALPGLDARRVPALLLGPGGADLIDLDGDRPGTLALAARLRDLLPGGAALTVTLVTTGADRDAPPMPDTMPRPDATPTPDITLVPGGDPDALAGALRASVRQDGPARLDPATLIARLDVRPARLSFLRGRVLSALDGQGVPGVQVWAQAGQSELRTRTDAQGTYALSTDQGYALEIGFVPPLRYRAPETLRLNPHGPYLSVEDTRLPERTSRLSEDDLRASMMQAMQTRLETLLARDPQAWTDPARQLEAVTEDLRAGLSLAAQEVAARQQEPLPVGAGLAVRVRHAADQLLLAGQARDLGRDLDALNTPPGAQQQTAEHQEAVQRAIDTLTGVAASRSSEQRRTAPPPARTASLHTRLPLPVPETAPALWAAPDLRTGTPQPLAAVPTGDPGPQKPAGLDTEFGHEFSLDTEFGLVREFSPVAEFATVDDLAPVDDPATAEKLEPVGEFGPVEEFSPVEPFQPEDGPEPDDGVLLTGPAVPRGPITEVVMADPRPGPVPPAPVPAPAVHTAGAPVTPAATQARPARRALPVPWIAGGLLTVAALTAAALTLGGREAPAPAQTAAVPAQVGSVATVPDETSTVPVAARPAPRVAATVTPRPIPAPAAPRVTVTVTPTPTAAQTTQPQATQSQTTQPQATQIRAAQTRPAGGRPTGPTQPVRSTSAAGAAPARAAAPESAPVPTAPATPPTDTVTPEPDLPFIEPPLPAPKTPGGPAQTDTGPGTPTSDPVPPAPTPEPAETPPPAADPASIPATPPVTPAAPDTPGN